MECNAIGINMIPREIEEATYEAALRELTTPGGLLPDVVVADPVTSERVGSLAVTYAAKVFTVADRQPLLTIIDDILAPLIGPRQQVLFGTTGLA